MNPRKDLHHLHVRIKPLTAEKLKAWSEELGHSYGETIDYLVSWYEEFCNKQDEVLEQTEIHDTLQRLIEKVDAIGARIK